MKRNRRHGNVWNVGVNDVNFIVVIIFGKFLLFYCSKCSVVRYNYSLPFRNGNIELILNKHHF